MLCVPYEHVRNYITFNFLSSSSPTPPLWHLLSSSSPTSSYDWNSIDVRETPRSLENYPPSSLENYQRWKEHMGRIVKWKSRVITVVGKYIESEQIEGNHLISFFDTCLYRLTLQFIFSRNKWVLSTLRTMDFDYFVGFDHSLEKWRIQNCKTMFLFKKRNCVLPIRHSVIYFTHHLHVWLPQHFIPGVRTRGLVLGHMSRWMIESRQNPL